MSSFDSESLGVSLRASRSSVVSTPTVSLSRQQEYVPSPMQNDIYVDKDVELLKVFLSDSTFIDFFNVFMNLPVFGQRLMISFNDCPFSFKKPVTASQTELHWSKLLKWLSRNRLPQFKATGLFLEYRLCLHLRDAQLRDTRHFCMPHTGRPVSMTAFRNLIEKLMGHVMGIRLFRQSLEGTCGAQVFDCWLALEELRMINDKDDRWLFRQHVAQRFLNSCSPSKLKSRYPANAYLEFLNFKTTPEGLLDVPDFSHVPPDHIPGEPEVHVLASERSVGILQKHLLHALSCYWIPRYAINVAAIMPENILEELLGENESMVAPTSSVSLSEFIANTCDSTLELPTVDVLSPECPSPVDTTKLETSFPDTWPDEDCCGIALMPSPWPPRSSASSQEPDFPITSPRWRHDEWSNHDSLGAETPSSHVSLDEVSLGLASADSPSSHSPPSANGTLISIYDGSDHAQVDDSPAQPPCSPEDDMEEIQECHLPVNPCQVKPICRKNNCLPPLTAWGTVCTGSSSDNDTFSYVTSTCSVGKEADKSCSLILPSTSSCSSISSSNDSAISEVLSKGLDEIALRQILPDAIVRLLDHRENTDSKESAVTDLDVAAFLGITCDKLAGSPFKNYLRYHECYRLELTLEFWEKTVEFLQSSDIPLNKGGPSPKDTLRRFIIQNHLRRIIFYGVAPNTHQCLEQLLVSGKNVRFLELSREIVVQNLGPRWRQFVSSDYNSFNQEMYADGDLQDHFGHIFISCCSLAYAQDSTVPAQELVLTKAFSAPRLDDSDRSAVQVTKNMDVTRCLASLSINIALQQAQSPLVDDFHPKLFLLPNRLHSPLGSLFYTPWKVIRNKMIQFIFRENMSVAKLRVRRISEDYSGMLDDQGDEAGKDDEIPSSVFDYKRSSGSDASRKNREDNAAYMEMLHDLHNFSPKNMADVMANEAHAMLFRQKLMKDGHSLDPVDFCAEVDDLKETMDLDELERATHALRDKYFPPKQKDHPKKDTFLHDLLGPEKKKIDLPFLRQAQHVVMSEMDIIYLGDYLDSIPINVRELKEQLGESPQAMYQSKKKKRWRSIFRKICAFVRSMNNSQECHGLRLFLNQDVKRIEMQRKEQTFQGVPGDTAKTEGHVENQDSRTSIFPLARQSSKISTKGGKSFSSPASQALEGTSDTGDSKKIQAANLGNAVQDSRRTAAREVVPASIGHGSQKKPPSPESHRSLQGSEVRRSLGEVEQLATAPLTDTSKLRPDADGGKMKTSNQLVVVTSGGEEYRLDKVIKDLNFMHEVQRFVGLCDQFEDSTELQIGFTPFNNKKTTSMDLVEEKADAIITCYLNSECPPPVQINLPPSQANKIIQRFQKKGAKRHMFHAATMHVFPFVFAQWKRFMKDWACNGGRKGLGKQIVLAEDDEKERTKALLERRREMGLLYNQPAKETPTTHAEGEGPNSAFTFSLKHGWNFAVANVSGRISQLKSKDKNASSTVSPGNQSDARSNKAFLAFPEINKCIPRIGSGFVSRKGVLVSKSLSLTAPVPMKETHLNSALPTESASQEISDKRSLSHTASDLTQCQLSSLKSKIPQSRKALPDYNASARHGKQSSERSSNSSVRIAHTLNQIQGPCPAMTSGTFVQAAGELSKSDRISTVTKNDMTTISFKLSDMPFECYDAVVQNEANRDLASAKEVTTQCKGQQKVRLSSRFASGKNLDAAKPLVNRKLETRENPDLNARCRQRSLSSRCGSSGSWVSTHQQNECSIQGRCFASLGETAAENAAGCSFKISETIANVKEGSVCNSVSSSSVPDPCADSACSGPQRRRVHWCSNSPRSGETPRTWARRPALARVDHSSAREKPRFQSCHANSSADSTSHHGRTTSCRRPLKFAGDAFHASARENLKEGITVKGVGKKISPQFSTSEIIVYERKNDALRRRTRSISNKVADFSSKRAQHTRCRSSKVLLPIYE